MTPDDEARFIQLWQQGLTTDAIAQQLGLKAGTARSRAYALQQQGKIPPRPEGGNRRTPARQDGSPPPVQTPVQITALPPYPKGKAVRWNLWILDAIRDDLAALAAEREVSPSQLVQEFL